MRAPEYQKDSLYTSSQPPSSSEGGDIDSIQNTLGGVNDTSSNDDSTVGIRSLLLSDLEIDESIDSSCSSESEEEIHSNK